MISPKQLVQTDNPAIQGRRERIEELRTYIEANRKMKNRKQILNGFCVETGLRPVLVKEYFKLLVAAGLYMEPTFDTNWKIIPPRKKRRKDNNKP